MSSPADIIFQALIEDGQVFDPRTVESGDDRITQAGDERVTAEQSWPLYVAFLPDDFDNAICVIDTAGKIENRLMRTGQWNIVPGIMIQVRGTDYPVVWEKANDIALALDGFVNILIDLSSDESYTVNNVSRKGDIIPVGIETVDERRRHYFTINAMVNLTSNT